MIETTVRFAVNGQTVIGTLALPPGLPAPVVLLFHGFTGSRHEMETPVLGKGIFAHAAERLAAAGLASLRIDFRGSGESDGAFADTTYDGQATDGLAAIEFLDRELGVDASRLGIIGWSQGGLIAALVAGRSPRPAAVALWAPVAEPVPTLALLFGAERIAQGRKLGGKAMTLDLPWDATIQLRQGFFEGVHTVRPLEEIARYPHPLFVAEGSNDPVIPPGAAEAYADAHPGITQTWIRPMDHAFNAERERDMLDALMDATVAFLRPQLLG